MANNTKRLRARLLGSDQPTDGKMVEALASRLADDEAVAHKLTSTDPLVHEHDGETRKRGGSDGGTLLAVTDRKLVFVVDTKTGRKTADIPFTDLKRIERDDGILSATLVLTVWGRGTFRFTPTRKTGVDELVAYATAASQTWQRVVAALQDARQHISMLESRGDDGEMDAAAEARESAVDHIETAADRITVGDEEIQRALTDRVESVREELRASVMHTRASRGRELLDRAATETENREYDAASRTLQQAHEHFDWALTIAIEDGDDAAATIQADLDDLADQERALLARPLERAEQARERAQAAGDPEQAVAAWETALTHYRETLRAGWGVDAEFEGDPAALRLQIEWVVAKTIHERQRVADTLETTARQHRVAGERERAAECYESALDQLTAARQLASEHRAGDASALERRVTRLAETRRKLD